MLGFPLLYFKGMRLLMFQLSGFYYRFGGLGFRPSGLRSLLAKYHFSDQKGYQRARGGFGWDLRLVS